MDPYAPPELTIEASSPEFGIEPLADEVLVVPIVGPRGPQGFPGAAGGSAYIHTQAEPAATWIVEHDLGRKTHVTVYDATEAVVFADVVHGTPDQTTIEFAAPVTGSALFS